MTLIGIPDQQADALKAKAASHGLSLEAWLKELAEESSPSPVSRANRREKAREFVEWARSHPHTPPLSDEAASRASLNPERW